MRYDPLRVIPRDVIDYSFGSNLEKCPRLTFYKYGVNRTQGSNASLDFGSAYHLYREHLEKQIIILANEQEAHNIALSKALDSYENPPLSSKKYYLDRNRLKQSCELAFTQRKQDIKSGIVVLSTEIAFDLHLPSGRRYGGKIDQTYEWNRQPWIKDFKSKSWMLSDSELYSLDNQMSGYCWAYQQLSGQKIANVRVEIMYNTEKQKPVIKPLTSTRTEADIENFIVWAEDAWDRYEKYLKTEKWPMNTTSCFDYNKRCDWFDACQSGSWESVLTWLEDNSFEKIWDFSHTGEE